MDELISTKEIRKRQIKYAFIWFLIIALIFVFYIYIFSANKNIKSIKSSEVGLYSVARDSLKETIIIDTQVMPEKVFFLDLSTGGKVKEVFVVEGQQVEKGQKIVELENNSLKLSIISRESQITEQINNLRNTRIALEKERLDVEREKVELKYQIKKLKYKLDKEKRMLSKGAIPKDQYQQSQDEYEYYLERDAILVSRLKRDDELRKNQLSQIEEGIASLTNNLNFSKSLLEQLVIRAPTKGKITSLQTELGEYVTEGSRIGQVDIEGDIKLVAWVDEFYLGDIKLGAIAKKVINEGTYTLEVGRINSEIIDGKFEVIFHFKKSIPKNLKRGQSLPLNLNLTYSENTLVLSNDAIFSTTDGKWVFLLDEQTGTATKKTIKISRVTNQFTEIKNGLSEGDVVVHSDVIDLSNYTDLNIENIRND